MSLRQGWRAAAVLVAALTAAAWSGAARADGDACPAGGCATGACPMGACGTCASGKCGPCLCCPKTTFCIEKPPKICFKCVCSKPICDMCSIEGNGYFATCWRPFAYPPNYSHCPVPPPGVLVDQAPPLAVDPTMMPAPAGDALPAPRRAANPYPDR